MYLPIMIDVQQKNILVVGGGKIGFRRAKKMMEYGANVTIVSKTFISEFETMLQVNCKQKTYSDEDLKDMFLVIAATDDVELNQRIGLECKLRHILCNRADDMVASELFIPASFTQNGVTLAVSTQGQSPTYSKLLMETFKEFIDSESESKLNLLGDIRGLYKQRRKERIQTREYSMGDLLHLSVEALEAHLEELKR